MDQKNVYKCDDEYKAARNLATSFNYFYNFLQTFHDYRYFIQFCFLIIVIIIIIIVISNIIIIIIIISYCKVFIYNVEKQIGYWDHFNFRCKKNHSQCLQVSHLLKNVFL